MYVFDLREKLLSQQYELSDLGDGSAAFISLTTGKIITLNKLGTYLVNKLLETESKELTIEELVLSASIDIAEQHNNDKETVKKDVNEFLQQLIAVSEQ